MELGTVEGLVLKKKMNIFYLKLGISREVKGSKQGLWSLKQLMCSPKLGSKERKRTTASQTFNREWQGGHQGGSGAAAAWRDPAVWEMKRALGKVELIDSLQG